MPPEPDSDPVDSTSDDPWLDYHQSALADPAPGPDETTPDALPQGLADPFAPAPDPGADAVTGADAPPTVENFADVRNEGQLAPPHIGSYEDVQSAQLAAANQAMPGASAEMQGGPPDLQAPAMSGQLPSAQQRASQAVAKSAVNAMSPDELTQYKADRVGSLIAQQAAEQHKADLDNLRSLKEHNDAIIAANAKAHAETQEVAARANVLANTKIKSKDQSIWQRIGIAIGGAMSQYTGGKNLALEQFNKGIDDDIAAQKADIANGWRGLDTRKGIIADELARSGNLYKAQETYRLTAYQGAINEMQTHLQQFDPEGATALRGRDALDQLHAAQLQHANAFHQQVFKEDVETTKAIQDQQKINETAREHDRQYDLKLRKMGAGAGAGSNTNPNYTVATGIFNPFTLEPVFAKRELSTKGEKSESRVVAGQIATYAHVQDGWARLAAIGAKIDYHKSQGEQVWSRLKNTDAAEYDAATSSLVVGITKELGDKLTQGQLDEQGHRIPQRAGWLDGRDVGKMIADAQQESDESFIKDVNTVGVDGVPIVRAAQARRAAAVPPSADDELSSAQQAEDLAHTPSEKKDAREARERAQGRLVEESRETQQGRRDVAAAGGLQGPDPEIKVSSERPESHAQIGIVNKTAATYGEQLRKFREIANDAKYLKGLKGTGDIVQATKLHNTKVAKAAADALTAKKHYDTERKELEKHLPKYIVEPKTATHENKGMGDVDRSEPVELPPGYPGGAD